MHFDELLRYVILEGDLQIAFSDVQVRGVTIIFKMTIFGRVAVVFCVHTFA